MPRIQTYTANLTTPPSQTGVDLSIASSQQPGEALAGLGHEIGKFAGTAAIISEQIAKEKEIKYASESSQKFTEESIRWQQANGNQENSGEEFKKWSDQRIQQISAEAPNARGAMLFKQHVLPQANSDWRQNLAKGEQVRLNNFKTGEDDASQTSQDAFGFRYKESPVAAMDIRTEDLKNQLGRINTAYGKVAPAHAADMSEQSVVSAVLGATEQNPSYARKLLNDFPLVDAQKRASLLAHIKAAEAQQNQGALFDLTQSWQSAMEVAKAQGNPAPVVPSEQLFTALSGEHGREIHAQLQRHADVQNSAVSTIDELKGIGAGPASVQLADKFSKLGPDEGAKAEGLQTAHEWLSRSWKLQEKDPVAWQIANQEPVATLYQQAAKKFKEADSLPDGSAGKYDAMTKASQIQDRAFTLSKFLQGPAPANATDAEKAMFLNHTDTHIISTATAEHYAQQIEQAPPEQRIKIARSLQVQYGDHSADFFADLATMPSDSKGLSPALIQGLNIQNDRHASAYMQAQTGKGAEGKLDPNTFKTYTTTLDANPAWNQYMHGWLGEYNQRDKFMASSREGILNYAVSLELSGQAKDPQSSVKMAMQHVVTDQVGMATVNGRTIPMARMTKSMPSGQQGPVLGGRVRTDDEVNDIGRGLSILLRQVNPMELDRRPFVTAPPGEQGADFIMRRIWTNGYYVTDHDGQSATLYIPADDGPIQVRDKNNAPLRVVFDQVPAFTIEGNIPQMTGYKMGTPGLKPSSGTIKQQPSDFESGFGKQSKSILIPGESIKGAESDLPILMPGTRIDTTSWNWPTTSKVFTH